MGFKQSRAVCEVVSIRSVCSGPRSCFLGNYKVHMDVEHSGQEPLFELCSQLEMKAAALGHSGFDPAGESGVFPSYWCKQNS